mgnify:CR=1 FL=1
MTLTQLRTEVYANSGYASDINPSTDTSYNSGPILTWVINEAQRQIAFWKDPSIGRQLRFRSLLAETYFSSKVIDETLDDAGSTTTAVILPAADIGTQDDRYNGWVIEIGGETRLIVDYVGSTRTATLHTALSSAPSSGDAYTLMKRHFLLLPSTHAWLTSPTGEHISLPATSDIYRAEGNLYEVLKIEDIDDQAVLGKAARTDSIPEYLSTTGGNPREWYRFGNKIYFDLNLDETRYFRMEYYRLPTDMSADSDTPEIPATFEYGIILWGTAWVYRRKQESTDLYATMKEFETFMRARASQYDVEYERESPSLRLEVR